ncbi:PTS sugar transporter subunit IIA [bacterium]|jgi:PTS system nitrogen regulatory IIA component|nr:PTS sugar transporter subunit IIA [bacterium]
MKKDISQYLDRKNVIFLKASAKKEALSELTDALARNPGISDKKELEEGIWRREKLMSTGIGLGIAVPHVRIKSVQEPVLAVGLSSEGIKDYESLDNNPVKIIIMIAAGEKQHAMYISLLSAVTSVLKEASVREKILSSASTEEIYVTLTGS